MDVTSKIIMTLVMDSAANYVLQTGLVIHQASRQPSLALLGNVQNCPATGIQATRGMEV